MRIQRHSVGTVRYDKRRKTWNYLWYDGPVRRSRRIGNKQDFPTKAAAWQEVKRSEAQVKEVTAIKTTMKVVVAAPEPPQPGDTMQSVITRYELERMPARRSTARVYRSFLRNHIEPKWGKVLIHDIQPRPVELWLKGLALSPKSKTHVRSLMHSLVEFAMWAGILSLAVNPMSLVQNKGATKKVRKARSLTADQYQAFFEKLKEPFGTLFPVCACLGLRISEALALRWSDVDWEQSRLSVERGIVNQIVDDVKTPTSEAGCKLAPELLEQLRTWKGITEFDGGEDWIFASPFQLGRLPYSYTTVLKEIKLAADAAGIGKIGTHAMRHTYRSWLDAVGAKTTVQQKLMRHTDIRTTLNVYGDVVTDEMITAAESVSKIAFANKQSANRARAELSC